MDGAGKNDCVDCMHISHYVPPNNSDADDDDDDDGSEGGEEKEGTKDADQRRRRTLQGASSRMTTSSSSTTTAGNNNNSHQNRTVYRLKPGLWTQLSLTVSYDSNILCIYADGEVVATAISSNLQVGELR